MKIYKWRLYYWAFFYKKYILNSIYLLLLYVWMFCGHVSLCTMYIQFPLRPEGGIRSPRTGFTDGCELLGIEPRSSRRAARPRTHWVISPALSWAFLAFKRIVLGVYSCFLSHISSLFLVSRFLCRKQGYTKAIPANVCVESEWSEKYVNKNWILEKLEGKSRNLGLFSSFSCRLGVMLDVLGMMRLPLCVLT